MAIGFYPWNSRGQSRWAAIDFDAHDGSAARAKALALAAFQILRRQPNSSLFWPAPAVKVGICSYLAPSSIRSKIGCGSLSESLTRSEPRSKTGFAKYFPNETRIGSRPHAIRAPGTWNPKTNQFGAIFFTSIRPLFQKKRKREESSFLYYSTEGASAGQLNDSECRPLYCGGYQNWPEQFAITHSGTRHEQVRKLVYRIFRQVGHSVGRELADRHTQPRESSRRLHSQSTWKNLKNSGTG